MTAGSFLFAPVRSVLGCRVGWSRSMVDFRSHLPFPFPLRIFLLALPIVQVFPAWVMGALPRVRS